MRPGRDVGELAQAVRTGLPEGGHLRPGLRRDGIVAVGLDALVGPFLPVVGHVVPAGPVGHGIAGLDRGRGR